jgi:hypothetical protein
LTRLKSREFLWYFIRASWPVKYPYLLGEWHIGKLLKLSHSCWDHSNDEFMRYLVLVFMMHQKEGGGSPQIKVDIQRRLIAHVTMHVIAPTIPESKNILQVK